MTNSPSVASPVKIAVGGNRGESNSRLSNRQQEDRTFLSRAGSQFLGVPNQAQSASQAAYSNSQL